MIRVFIGATLGGLAVVAVAAAMLVFSVPRAGAAEACQGHWASASWYGAESGSKTASGLYFDGTQWLVAHKSLPFGTKLRLTYRGRSVVVPVNDRGPYIKGRELDLSEAVARKLGTKAAGVAKVCMQIVR